MASGAEDVSADTLTSSMPVMGHGWCLKLNWGYEMGSYFHGTIITMKQEQYE
jgi:hypothetical protein